MSSRIDVFRQIVRDSLPLNGRRIVVTGAGRGVGAAIARACAAAGAVVGVNYFRSYDAATAMVSEDEEHYRLVPFDVRDVDAVQRGLDAFVKQEGRIDALVNNSGIFCPGFLVRAPISAVLDQISTNLLGPILCSRAALPHLLRAGGGVILNISSVATQRPVAGQSIYAATKGGLEALTRALAAEYGSRGIRANWLRLGPIDTDMLAQVRSTQEDALLSRMVRGRFGTVAEVAQIAVMLLSDDATFITGAVHTIDGGYLQG